MNEIQQLSKRLGKIEQSLEKLRTKSSTSVDDLTTLSPLLLNLKNALEDSQKFTTQSLSTTDYNSKDLEQLKTAAKLLHEETSKLVSSLHSSVQTDAGNLSSEILGIASAIGLADRKLIMDLKAAEEQLAIESLRVANNYFNLCEGTKDYVKACGATKAKSMGDMVAAGIREIEALIQEIGRGENGKNQVVNEIVGKIANQQKEKIVGKLKAELDRKMGLLQAAMKAKAKEVANEYIYGTKGDTTIKNIKEELRRLEAESEKVAEAALDSIANLEIELGDFEIDYLEKIHAINREDDPIKKETEKRKMFTEVLEFDKKCQDIIGKIIGEFSERETAMDTISQDLLEAIREYSNNEDATMVEVGKGLAKERERIDIKRKSATNYVKGKVVELKRQIKMQTQLAEQYGARAKMSKREIVKNSAGDDVDVADEEM